VPPVGPDGWPAGDRLEQALAKLAPPTHWPSLEEADLAPALDGLGRWVDQLIDRFALDVRTVPPCWHQHNAMVEALSALRDHERGCFADTASPTAAVDFIRAVREITQYLRETAAQTQCSAREHRADLGRGQGWS
jgi:hypothetical protein